MLPFCSCDGATYLLGLYSCQGKVVARRPRTHASSGTHLESLVQVVSPTTVVAAPHLFLLACKGH
jgi:hypothetical protein